MFLPGGWVQLVLSSDHRKDVIWWDFFTYVKTSWRLKLLNRFALQFCSDCLSLPASLWWEKKKNGSRESWIKRDQLDVTCFFISLFNAQHVSDVSTSILRSLRLICWVISWVVLFWFDVCWCYGAVWLGWCGTLMQAEALVLQLAYGYNSTNKSQAPEDGCTNIWNMLSIK